MSKRSAEINYSLHVSERERPDNFAERVDTRLSIEAPQEVIINGLKNTIKPQLRGTDLIKSGLLDINKAERSRMSLNLNLNRLGDYSDQADRLFVAKYISGLIGAINMHDINGREDQRNFRILHWDNREKNKFGFLAKLPKESDFRMRKAVLTGMIDASLAITPNPKSLIYEPKKENYSQAHASNSCDDVAFRRGAHCDSDLNKHLLAISVATIVPYQTGAEIVSDIRQAPVNNYIKMEGHDGPNPIARFVVLAGALALAQSAVKLDPAKV